MIRLAQILGKNLWWMAATALLAFFSHGAGLALVAVAAYLIAKASTVQSSADLALAITGVRAFATFKVVIRYVERYVGHLATFRTLTRLRTWFFDRISRVPMPSFERATRGGLLESITTDVDILSSFPLRAAVPPAVAAMTVVAGAILLGWIDPVLAAPVAVGSGIASLGLAGISRWAIGPTSAELGRTRSEMSSATVEMLDGIEDLVAAGREDLLADRLDAFDTREANQTLKLSILRAISKSLVLVIASATAITAFAIAVPMVTASTLDPLLLAVIPLVCIAAFEAVEPLTAAAEELQASRVAMRNLDALTAVVEPAVPDLVRPPATPTAVAFHEVSFAHQGGPPLLDHLNLEIEGGSHVGITGANGSGKSTLVELLLGWHQPTRGEITIGSVDVAKAHPAEVAALVGVVLQPDHVFDSTVADNLLVANAEATTDSMMDALSSMDLRDTAETDLLTRPTGPDGSSLSGGERQRLMTARALLTEAPVLVLDETLAQLDQTTARKVMRTIRERRRGLTTIFISHEAEKLVGLDRMVDLGSVNGAGNAHEGSTPQSR